MSDFDESAALDADAGPGATAILSGMLHTLSEVLGRLDERLGRLEARAVTPPVEVDVDRIAETVLDRLRGDDTLRRTVDGAIAPLGHAVDDLRTEVASRRDAEPVDRVVERAVAAATERLGQSIEGVWGELLSLREAEPVGQAVERAMAAATERLGYTIEAELASVRDTEPVERAVAAATERIGVVIDDLRAEVAALRDADPVTPAVERLGSVVDGLRGEVASLRDAEPVGQAVERALAAATESLRHAIDDLQDRVAERTGDEELASLRRTLDEALMALGDRNEAHALGVREMVAQLSSELRRLAEDDDGEAADPDVAALVAEAAQGTERSLARLHADLRGAVEDLALAMAERSDGQAAALARMEAELRTAIGAQAGAVHDIQAALGDRLEAELRAQVGPLHEAQAAAAERAAAELREQLAAVQDTQATTADRLVAELRAQVAPLHDLHAAGTEHLAEEVRAQLAPLQDAQAALVARLEAEVQAVVAGQAGALHEIQAAVVERLEGQGTVLERLRAEMSAQAFAVEQLRSDAADRPPVAAEGIARVEASLEHLHAELDERSAGQVALVDRLVAEQAAALFRVEADVEQGLASVRAQLADRPDAAALAAEHADALRRALEEAVSTLAERQAATNASLHQAVDGLRSELVALAAPIGDDAADDASDDAEATAAQVAELLARQAAVARDDLARIETVLRGQVAEVSGRANSMTDVIGRLDGRLHEVVDGVRALSRHLEATASLVPAVEALRGEVDELRRLSEQPRLRAVNGGSGD